MNSTEARLIEPRRTGAAHVAKRSVAEVRTAIVAAYGVEDSRKQLGRTVVPRPSVPAGWTESGERLVKPFRTQVGETTAPDPNSGAPHGGFAITPV